MNSFKYEETMEESEITQKVKELLRYMRTDEYWLKRGGNGPYQPSPERFKKHSKKRNLNYRF